MKAVIEVFREHIYEHMTVIKAHCFPEFGTIRYNKNRDEIIAYGKCKHNQIHENEFKFIIQDVFLSSVSNLVICCTGSLFHAKKGNLVYKNFLRAFRQDAIEAKIKWCPFKSIFIDWSISLWQAICSGFNDMNVQNYLLYVYAVLREERQPKNEITVLVVCVSHFIKSVTRQFDTKALFLNMIAILLNCNDLAEFDKVFEIVCYIFCSKTKTKLTENNVH